MLCTGCYQVVELHDGRTLFAKHWYKSPASLLQAVGFYVRLQFTGSLHAIQESEPVDSWRRYNAVIKLKIG